VATPVDDKIIDRVCALIHGATDVEVEKEVARLSLEFPSITSQDDDPTEIRVRAQTHAVAAIQHATKFRSFTKDQLCTPQHLRWKQVCLYSSPFLLLTIPTRSKYCMTLTFVLLNAGRGLELYVVVVFPFC